MDSAQVHETLDRSIGQQIAKRLDYLAARWQDEKEYEDFAEYKDAMRSTLKSLGFTMTNFTKRPFQVEFVGDDRLCRFMKVQGRRIVAGYYARPVEVVPEPSVSERVRTPEGDVKVRQESS